MNSTWKVFAVFVGIFLAGAVVGGFASPRFIKSYVQNRGAPEQFPAMHLLRISERLNIDEAQKKRIEAVLKDSSDEWMRIRKDTEAYFTRLNVRVMAELTPEQKTEYEDWQKRIRERMRNRPPGGPGGPRDERDRNPNRMGEKKLPAIVPGEALPPPPEKP